MTWKAGVLGIATAVATLVTLALASGADWWDV